MNTVVKNEKGVIIDAGRAYYRSVSFAMHVFVSDGKPRHPIWLSNSI